MSFVLMSVISAIGRMIQAKLTNNIALLVQLAVTAYNSQEHRTTSMRPIDAVQFANRALVLSALRNRAYDILSSGPATVPRYGKNSRVRIRKLSRGKFAKSHQVTVEEPIYTVHDVLHSEPECSYILKSVDSGELIEGSVLESLLVPAAEE